MYIRLSDGRAAKRPAVPENVSLPRNPSDDTLAALGYALIHPTARPEGGVVTQGQPEKGEDGRWYQTWEVRDFTDDELAEREQRQRVELAQQIADRRWQAETGGTTISGMPLDTGRDSQALITGAALAAMLDPEYSVQWKTQGGFVDLTAEQIIAVASAVRAHVQACFDREAELLEALEAGTFTPEMLEDGWPDGPVPAPAES